MSLSRKFLWILLVSILSIAVLNIAVFYMFYNSYIKLYLSDKIDSRQEVTIDYINNIIERQTLEDIDDIFNDVEIEFFELLDINDWVISLQDEENVSIVVDFLARSWVSSKYIEEMIPENNLEKVLFQLQEKDSPESKFISRLFWSLILANIIILSSVIILVVYFIRRTLVPIKKATNDILKLRPWKDMYKIDYKKKDEIGLLIQSINNLNSRLSVQEKIRSRLLADISHELKTPITSIQCYLEWISDWVIELSEKNLESITSEMSRLVDLVNKIMEYEKFENSDIKIEKKVHNPYEIITWVVQTLWPVLQEKQQIIEVQWSENIELYLDKSLFTQVVYNLIWNFQKYSGDKTHLVITVSSKQISFKDNWKWIAKRELPYLFDKFYQGKKEKTWSIDIRWIGVGLSVVKKIIDEHSWGMAVKSDAWKWFEFIVII